MDSSTFLNLHCLTKKFLTCSCQTYEGGISGEPGSEAHGGYVSCCTCFCFCLCLLPNLQFPTLLFCMNVWPCIQTAPWFLVLVFSVKSLSVLKILLIRYTFCGLATMVLIGEVDRLDLTSLIVRLLFLLMMVILCQLSYHQALNEKQQWPIFRSI